MTTGVLSLLCGRAMNAPDRFELFIVPDGCKKVTFEKDTKVPSAGAFLIMREDHTLGNLLRMQLLRDEDVLFAGYKMPHPLEHNIVVKVQTRDRTTPMNALNGALIDLQSEFTELERVFKVELDRRRQPHGEFYQ